MVELDRLTIEEVGIAAVVLMEVAGRRVADVAQDYYEEDGRPVLAVAGTGNNGADAIVAARHLLERGVPVTAIVLGPQDKLTADAETQIRIARRLGLPITLAEGETALSALRDELETCGTVIDGLFGTGLGRSVTGWRETAIDAIGEHEDLRVVAVDIPSGVDADTGQVLGVAVQADATVTFQFPKLGHVHYPGRRLTGELTIADISIPPSLLPRVAPSAYVVSTGALRDAFVPRAGASHKGTYGHLLIVAGAPDKPGAALMAGRAALRAGAGLVTVGSDQETIRRLAGHLEALMGHTLGEHRPQPEAISTALSSRTALAIGPSLAPDERTAAMVKAVLEASAVPAIVDAGALAAIGTDVAWLAKRSGATVLTPHPGEMARLTGLDTVAVQQDRLRVARDLAATANAHVVLKGASTIVAHPDGQAGVVMAGNPGMATGGTGDVLTGIVGALLAQGVEPGTAAEAGALAHAMAGDGAAQVRGEASLMAPDLIEHLSGVIRTHVEDEGGEE